jgi:hypothetical protein
MGRIKVWPHVAVLAILCVVLGAVASELWFSHKQHKEESSTLPSAARIERTDGEVGLNHSAEKSSENQWTEATPNTPVSVGDRIYTGDKGRTSIAFTGRNFARLNDHAALDVLSLSDDRTQVALRDGSALFNVGSLASGQLFEIATPCGAVDLEHPGLYQIGINNDGSAVASVLSGQAQVVGLGGTGVIDRGEQLALCDQSGANPVLSRLDTASAGALVDDYYRYQYPKIYDGRYRDYDAYLNDPYYYDPYNRYVSYKYVSDWIPGVEDLDDYGDWQDVSDYGYCWHPHVDVGWAPYQQGYWFTDVSYGLTWVSTEPWGYAPYHYGRWAYVNNGWFWIPERVHTYPTYAPALVAFIPLTQTNRIGWVPLGPGDPYVATYYDANWQPHYLSRTGAVLTSVANLSVPGAVTVVERGNFNRVISQNIIVRTDPQQFAHVRPVLDPFAVETLRQAALQNREAQRRIEIPQSIAQRLDNTRVITSTAPVAPPFRNNLAQALHVEPVPANQRQARLQFRDDRQAAATQAPGGIAQAPGQVTNPAEVEQRNRQIAVLKAEADRGNREAQRQMQALERQQAQSAAEAQRVGQPSAAQPGNPAQVENERTQQRAQGEQVGQQMRAQREAARQQAIAAQQQQRAITQQQVQARRQQNQQVWRQQNQPQIRMRPESPPARIQQQQERQQVIQQKPRPEVQVQPEPRPQARPEAGRAQVQQQTERPQPQLRTEQPAPQPRGERSEGRGKPPR